MAIATLPIVLAVVLTELAVGGAFLVWFVDRGGRAPSGFLKLVSIVDALAGIGALALTPTFPHGDLADRAGIDTGPLGAFAQILIVLVVLALVQTVVAFTAVRGLFDAAAAVTCLVGSGALGIAALARPAPSPYDPFGVAAPLLGAIALGGADGAMLLGHWYLVTPKLSPRPLRQAALVVVFAVVVQLVLVAIVWLRGDLTGTWETALSVALALRIGVGLLMTFLVALAAWWTAGMNTQSSTGLLYVGLGCVIAGEVSARVIFYLTGVPL